MRFRLLVGCVFLIALGVRIGHVAAILDSPVADTVVLDSKYYDDTARSLGGFSERPAASSIRFMNVGYPYFLATVYRITGPRVAAALWIQALVGAGVAVVLACLGRTLLDSRAVGVLAGLLYAFYRPAVFYTGLLLTPEATNASVAAVLLALALWMRRPRPWLLVVAGLAAGTAVLLRSNLVLLLPFLMLAVALVQGTLRRRAACALLFAVCAAGLPMLLVVWNGLTLGEWVPVSANGGMNLWVGNRIDATGVYSLSEFLGDEQAETEMRGFLEEARRRTGDPALTLASSSAFWFGEALRDIRSSPVRWVLLELRKFAFFMNREEPKTNVSMAFHEALSPVLRTLPFGFGSLALLGIAGLVFLALSGRPLETWLVASTVLASLATCLIFFVSGEYRHLASIGLCLAAASIVESTRLWISAWRRAGSAATPANAALAASAFVAAALCPLVFLSQPVLVASGHPYLDFSNFNRAILRGAAGDHPAPSAATYARAERLLALAPEREDGQLLLVEARLQVHCAAVRRLRDAAHAAQARTLIAQLASWEEQDGFAGYSERFVGQLRGTVASCSAAVQPVEQ